MMNTPLPQPPEEPPAPAPGDPAGLAAARPTARKFLRVSGIMIVVLCALNLALFRVDGLDLIFALAVVVGAICFLYQRFWPTMRIIWVFWAALTVPFWLLLCFLLFHMGLGTYAHYNPKPIPPELVRPVPPPEDVAALAELRRRFPEDIAASHGQEVADAMAKLKEAARAINKTVVATSPPEATYASASGDPEVQAAIAVAQPYLEDFIQFLHTHRPVHETVDINSNFPELNQMMQAVDAELLSISALAHTPMHAQELRARYRKLFQAITHQQARQGVLVTSLVQITLFTKLLNFLQEPVHTRALAGDLELPLHIQKARDQMKGSFANSLRGELQGLANFVSSVSNQSFWDTPGIVAPENHLRMVHRFSYWPFLVPSYTIANQTAAVAKLVDALEMPPEQGWHHIEQIDRSFHPMKLLTEPSPYGRVLSQGSMPVYSQVWARVKQLESRLAAFENALRWVNAPATGTEFTAGTDPMTGAPFYTAVVVDPPAADGATIERLVIGGGHPKIGTVSKGEKPKLQKHGLAGKYQYIIEITRPAVAQ